MRKIFSIIMLGMIFMVTMAQQKAERAPINPEFIRYIEHHGLSEKKSAGLHGTGYIPSPLYLHFNETHDIIESKKSTNSFPARYDLRELNLVTPVKDQGSAGACLSFSTMGAIESRWLKLGYGPYDLSEQNLATCHGFELGINDGGTFAMATAYLTRLAGPVTENSHPYHPFPSATCKEDGLVHTAFVPSVVWLPDDKNVIKKAILDYGAISAAIYTGGNYMGSYLNFRDHTFYYNGTTPADHAVLIVGWDDNKKISGGPESPDNAVGAWIVKNSWGTSWGEKGYFYVSYDDTRFLSSAAMFPERAELTDIDTLYMYDDLGATTSFGYREETAYGLVKFEAPAEQFIRRIGTFINSSGGVIDIEIYDDFQGDTLLTNLIASSYNNMSKFPGYYTFDIPVIVKDDYYVKIKYTTPDYFYPIPAEAPISYQGEDYAIPEIEDSGTFWISRDAEEWEALGKNIEDNDVDLSIRVYADRSTAINAFFTANFTEACVGSEIIFETASNGTITDYHWDFGEGANPAGANTAGPHSVSYSGVGLKDIQLIVSGPAGTDTLVRKNYIEAVEALDIFLPYSEKRLVDGKSITITAFGAENYSWSPSEGLSDITGQTVIASPVDTVTYTVNGTMGNCTGSASIKLNVVENPPNDDVCEAIQITKTGYIGKFTNIYATVEAGEPAPPEGECDVDMEWCVEGGLQNSVWFYFIAPESGVVSIDTKGMDNQLAVYKAPECDSVFEKSTEMVAAFDDYYGESQKYAAAIERVDVVPGEKYFIQVDGSAGGEEGNFTLYFYHGPLSVDEKFSDKNSVLNVYPNPGKGAFNVLIDDGKAGKVTLNVFDVSGRLIYTEEFMNIPGFNHNFKLLNARPGTYYLQIQTRETVYTKNLMVH